MDNFFREDVFYILLYPCLFTLFLFLIILWDRQTSRATVFLFGLALIALAGYIAHQLMIWRSLAESLTLPTAPPDKKITKETLAEFDRLSSYVLWLIPFLTGALGTNLISDAITKPLTYKKPFNATKLAVTITQGGRIATQLFLIILISPFLFLMGVIIHLRNLHNCPRRWRIYGKLYNRSYVQQNSKAKQPWES